MKRLPTSWNAAQGQLMKTVTVIAFAPVVVIYLLVTFDWFFGPLLTVAACWPLALLGRWWWRRRPARAHQLAGSVMGRTRRWP